MIEGPVSKVDLGGAQTRHGDEPTTGRTARGLTQRHVERVVLSEGREFTIRIPVLGAPQLCIRKGRAGKTKEAHAGLFLCKQHLLLLLLLVGCGSL